MEVIHTVEAKQTLKIKYLIVLFKMHLYDPTLKIQFTLIVFSAYFVPQYT